MGKMKLGKVPGENGITAEMLKRKGEVVFEYVICHAI